MIKPTKRAIPLLFAISALYAAFSPMISDVAFAQPAPSDPAATLIGRQADNPFETVVKLSAVEIRYGDALYITRATGFHADEADYARLGDFMISSFASPRITCDALEPNGGYTWNKSNALRKTSSQLREDRISPRQVEANHWKESLTLEFPPLDAWNEPFWKSAREHMTKEGLTCRLEFNCHGHDFCLEIRILPRSAGELSKLQSWRDDAANAKTKGAVAPKIKLGSDALDLRLFLHSGYAASNLANLPTQTTAWQKLEEELAPCALRDELEFARMQFAYYAVKDSDLDAALNDFIDWLGTLSQPRRDACLAFLKERRLEMEKTPLREKYRKLMLATFYAFDDSSSAPAISANR